MLKIYRLLSSRLKFTSVRLALFNSVFFVLGIWVTIALVYWQVSIYMEHRVDRIIDVYAKNFEALDFARLIEKVDVSVRRDSRKIDLYGVFTLDGIPISGNLKYLPREIGTDGQIREFYCKGFQENFKKDSYKGEVPSIFLARAKAIRVNQDMVLVVGRDISEFVAIRQILLNGLLIGSCVILALGIFIGFILAIKPLKRIEFIQELSHQIMLGNFGVRIPLSQSNDEIDMLASTVNLMLTEIEMLITEIKGVTETIAHDLRTPLTRVRLLLSKGVMLNHQHDLSAYEKRELELNLFTKSIEETDQLLERFTAILRIAEIENHMRKVGFKSVRLEDVLQQIYEMFEPLADEADLELILDLEPVVPVYADAELLLEAISNLVDNAIKFTAQKDAEIKQASLFQGLLKSTLDVSGERLKIRLTLKMIASSPVIEIVDSGPGLPAALFDSINYCNNGINDRPTAETRLHQIAGLGTSTGTQSSNLEKIQNRKQYNYSYVKDDSKQGSGLGLGIVNAIFRLHHFKMCALYCSTGTHLRIECLNPNS